MNRLQAVRGRLGSAVPAPLRRARFRQLWLGMASSYAGDRFQQLAQAWLVATLTSSALAVGWISALGSLPQLFMPLGGVIADLVDRRRLLITWQLVGAAATAIVAALVLVDHIAVWHIYAWAVVNGLIALLSRPAYKVVLTEVVPPDEVRPAVAINSMTETTSMVVVNGVGSVLLEFLGLTLAFILNAATYLAAAGSLWGLRDLSRQSGDRSQVIDVKRVLSDLIDGLRYLAQQPSILHPLLLTFVTIMIVGPAIGLLAAIVHAEDGSIIDLGLLAASSSVGAFIGAAFAGMRSAGANPTRRYAILGLVSAAAVALFALLPVGVISMVPLAVLGAGAFVQAVWNTSRIREQADPAYQARLQAITSMAFTLGFSLGMLWAGVAIDWFGLTALVGGSAVLGLLSVIVIIAPLWYRIDQEHALSHHEISTEAEMDGQVLVAYATKYGATAEIAEKIGEVLRGAELGVDVLPVDRVDDLPSYKAVILGSAAYVGAWRKQAAAFLKANEKVLAGQVVWLFSSGPTGEGDALELTQGWRLPTALQPIADRIQPRDVALFHGAVFKEKLSLIEKWMIKMVKAPAGDFRDWEAIAAWATAIAETLKEAGTASGAQAA